MKDPNLTIHQMVNPRHYLLSEATLANGCAWVAKMERKVASRATKGLAIAKVNLSTQEIRNSELMEPSLRTQRWVGGQKGRFGAPKRGCSDGSEGTQV